MTETYLWCTGWEDFQTFQTKRGKPWAPPWIKLAPALLDDHDFIDLTPEAQILLVKLWMLFARTRGKIRVGTSNDRETTTEQPRNPHETLTLDTRNLSRQVSQRVTKAQLASLNHAGFIEFCSGTVLERRRNAFWNRSTLEESRQEQTPFPNPNPDLPPTANGRHTLPNLNDILEDVPL